MLGLYTRRLPRSVTAWIAMLGILLSGFGPGLAAARQIEGSWTHICSDGGSRFVRTPADPAPGSGGKQPLLRGACPCCLTPADAPALPSDGKRTLVVPPAYQLFPPQFHERPQQFAWLRARPRAPPAFHT